MRLGCEMDELVMPAIVQATLEDANAETGEQRGRVIAFFSRSHRSQCSGWAEHSPEWGGGIAARRRHWSHLPQLRSPWARSLSPSKRA